MVVGWSIGDHMRAELVVDALQMAIWRRRPPVGTVAHSDHGSQYTSWVVATPRPWRCAAVATMRERQRAAQLYRGQIPSPGAPTAAWREDRVRFWAAIARGVKTEDAATDAGVSSPVGFRWCVTLAA